MKKLALAGNYPQEDGYSGKYYMNLVGYFKRIGHEFRETLVAFVRQVI